LSKSSTTGKDYYAKYYELKGAIKSVENEGEIISMSKKLTDVISSSERFEIEVDSIRSFNGKIQVIESKSLPNTINNQESWIEKRLVKKATNINIAKTLDLFEIKTGDIYSLKDVDELIFAISKSGITKNVGFRSKLFNKVDELNDAGTYSFKISIVEVD